MPNRFAALLFAVIVLAACGREESADPATAAETVTTSPDTAGTQFHPKDAQATAPPAEVALVQQDVQVTLADDRIEMPPVLPASQITFNVTNAGSREHSFEVEGGGIEKKLDRPLQPGQSAKLVADLRAGTYTVYCPVADHEERGMKRELVVR